MNGEVNTLAEGFEGELWGWGAGLEFQERFTAFQWSGEWGGSIYNEVSRGMAGSQDIRQIVDTDFTDIVGEVAGLVKIGVTHHIGLGLTGEQVV